ncbi:hypothetical protein NP493_109g07057 [Ridgeia piscesae]|uniref:Uncharacterized protein n=1 Tax=Ridgeia piscesae TaxID=27915 RepID=A0AAD9P704_RIDPI|nr:hypothetical protein NP493_109g07057 [Ridgeia piscesae]
MLYFSASLDSYRGVLRALSVATGSHMPRLPRVIPVRKVSSSTTSLVLAVDMEGSLTQDDGHTTHVFDDVPESAINSKVPLQALYTVLHHGQRMSGDSHRFNISTEPEDVNSLERLRAIYEELGAEDLEPILFTTLIEHPVIADMISNCNIFHSVVSQQLNLNKFYTSANLLQLFTHCTVVVNFKYLL